MYANFNAFNTPVCFHSDEDANQRLKNTHYCIYCMYCCQETIQMLTLSAQDLCTVEYHDIT